MPMLQHPALSAHGIGDEDRPQRKSASSLLRHGGHHPKRLLSFSPIFFLASIRLTRAVEPAGVCAGSRRSSEETVVERTGQRRASGGGRRRRRTKGVWLVCEVVEAAHCFHSSAPHPNAPAASKPSPSRPSSIACFSWHGFNCRPGRPIGQPRCSAERLAPRTSGRGCGFALEVSRCGRAARGRPTSCSSPLAEGQGPPRDRVAESARNAATMPP